MATVLPPAFGPERRTRRCPSSRTRSSGTASEPRSSALSPKTSSAERREAPVEERVPGLLQDERAVRLREDPLRAAGELGARLVAVQLREDLDGGGELPLARGEPRRERDEDPVDLLALLLERLGERVVRLHDGERLDEERLAPSPTSRGRSRRRSRAGRSGREAVAPPFSVT
jgi:hypothetical protein